MIKRTCGSGERICGPPPCSWLKEERPPFVGFSLIFRVVDELYEDSYT